MSKPIVYIAAPYRSKCASGIFHNIMQARDAAATVWRMRGVALCPHLNTFLFDGVYELPDKIWLEGDLLLLSKCDAAWFFDGFTASTGVEAEYNFCLHSKIKAFEDLHELEGFIFRFNEQDVNGV